MKYLFYLFIIFLLLIGSFLSISLTQKLETKSLGRKLITYYNAVSAQCDNSPDYGAGGQVAIKGKPTGHWFACNFLPFGAKIIVPKFTGNQIWICKDRMNGRYHSDNIDLLFAMHENTFDGAKRAEVFLVK